MENIYPTTLQRLCSQPVKLFLTSGLLLALAYSSFATNKDTINPKEKSSAKEKGSASGKPLQTRRVTSTPTITVLSPTRNQRNAPAGTSVGITFSEAMNATTASGTAMQVFGSRTGKRSGTFSGGGTAVATFSPGNAFKPGEVVSVTTTTTAQNTGGTALAKSHVYTFTTAAATAPANFIANSPLLSTGSQPHSVYPADFDGDGDMDLAVANAGSTYLTVRKNNGDATFTGSVNVALPSSAEAVYAADFDGDGDVDLAAANTGIGNLAIRMNDGTASFSGGADYSTSATPGSNPFDIAGGDFDGDGDIDLAVTLKAQNTIAIFTNNGSGVFTRSIAVGGSSPHALCAADFDSDGDIDLAITNTTSFLITVKMNDGTGFFSGGSTVSTPSNSQSIQAADFDGDGDMDLAAANISSNTVSVRLNDGVGNFSGSTEVAVGTQPYGVYAADLDGDGDMDMATANRGSNDLSVRINDGTGSFSGTTNITTGGTQAYALQATDFDGDNDLDLVVVNSGSNRCTMFLNRLPTGFNTPPTITTVANQSVCINTSSAALAFTVGDAETAAASLTVTATSSDITLVPNINLVLGGSGANRTVTVSPASGQSGFATITLTVTDGNATSTSSPFTFTVFASPVVGSNQTVCVNDASFALTGFSPAGGTWSGNGVSATGTFTPSGSLVGTQTLTYTVTQGSCTSSATKTVTVNALPIVSAGSNQAVCANDAAFTLSGFSPAGGVWSGSGVNASGTFTPSVGLVGTQTLTYTVTQGGCTNSATKTITVNALPAVNAGSNQTVCSDDAAFALTGFSPAGGAWSGNGVNASGTFTPSASLVGTQTLTYSVTQGGCTSSAIKSITVNALPVVNAGSSQTVCTNDVAFTLAGFNPAGGTWSGNGVSASGTFTPSASLIGTQTLTYTVNQSGCTASATKTVTVNAIPTVNAGTNQTVCANDAAFTLAGFSPAGGTWSGNGVDATGKFTPSASLGGAQTLTYTVTQGGCTNSATKTITVNALPTVNAGSNQTVCANDVPFTLTGFSPAGGTWSGNGINASGLFTPSMGLVGVQTLTYTVTQSGCTNPATKAITINSPPIVVAGSNETVCANAAAFTLTGFSPAGGTWSGNGIDASGLFTPSSSLVGAQMLTYTVTQNGCINTATKTVTVSPGFSVTGAFVNNSDCLAPNGSITISIMGGTAPFTFDWGNSISTQNRTGLPAGTYLVNVTDAGGCNASQSFTLSDPNAPTTFAITGGGTDCQGGAGFNVGLTGSENGVSYQLILNGSPLNTPMTGTGSALDFGSQSTVGNYRISAKNAGGCTSTMTGNATIVLQPKPSLSMVDPAPVCAPSTIDLTTLTITDANATTGTLSYWTDAAATTALSNPSAVATSGTYYVRKTTAGSCFDIKPVVVSINAAPTANAGSNLSVCSGDVALTLTGFSPAGGTWSGNGVDASGLFTPSSSPVGTQTLTYTIAQNGCTATATKTITVKATPSSPTAGANSPSVGEMLNLTGSNVSNATYQWSGPNGFTSTQQNPTIPNVTVAEAGTYSVTVTVNGCTSAAGTVDVVIKLPVSVTISLDSVAGQSGSSVVVPVRVKDFKNILSVQGSIQWNTAVATFAGVEQLGLLGMTATDFGTTQTSSGTLIFSWSDAALQTLTLPDNTILFAIRFNLVGNTGTSSAVTLGNSPTVVEVVGAGNQPITTNGLAGKISIINVVSVAGQVKSPTGATINGVSLKVSGGPTVQPFTTAADGAFQLDVTGGANFTVSAFKNNDIVSVNGITTLDLILIQRHILGLAPLATPYKLIAADVNQSGTITTLDIVLIRSMILQNTTSFPGNRLWTFVRSDYAFPSPTNPFPYDSTRTYTGGGLYSGQDFTGVRLGDVNDTWNSSLGRTGTFGEISFRLPDKQVLPGEEITVPVRVGGFSGVSGYQFTLNWNPQVLEFVEVQHGALKGDYGYRSISEGKLTTSWHESNGKSLSLPDDSIAFQVRFKVTGTLGSQSLLNINSALTTSEAYDDQLQPLSIVSATRIISVGEKTEPTLDGYELYPSQPNPFNDHTTLRFSVPQPESVSLMIYNSLGQVVKTFSQPYAAGEHQVRWNGNGESGAKLNSGTYFVQMRAGKFVKGRKVVLVE